MSPDEIHGQQCIALALCAKYRVEDPPRKEIIPIRLLRVHPGNRGGQYPNPETVRVLGQEILLGGFVREEADHQGVVVEEVPGDEQAKLKEYETYHAWNVKKAGGSHLAACFHRSSGTTGNFGTLSHSHLLLVLLAIEAGAKWRIPEDMEPANQAQLKKLVDQQGRFSQAAVAEHDPALAKALAEEGLSVEILSWRIWIEEPTACSLISNALNKAQELGLRTTEVTALRVLKGAVDAQLEASVAEKGNFQIVRQKIRHQLDAQVDEPDFVELFDFVVNLGSGKAPFHDQLLDFCQRYVNSKKRQLRFTAFGVAARLPVACPRTKVAIMMRAYNKAPRCTWCPEPEAWWSQESNAGHLVHLEDLLRFWQVTMRPAVQAAASRSEKKDALASELMANVCTLGAEALLRSHKERLVSYRKKALLLATRDVHKQVLDQCPRDVMEGVSLEGVPAWIDYDSLESDTEPGAAVAE